MKMLASKKLFIVGFMLLALFSISYAKSSDMKNTKSLKKHTDFLYQYMVYNFGGDTPVIYYGSPTQMQVQSVNDNKVYNTPYTFTDLGGQNFLVTWVDDKGNTQTHMINTKKGTAIAHTVSKNSTTPIATKSTVSITTNKATAMQASTSSK